MTAVRQKRQKQWAAFRRASSWQEWMAMAWLGTMPFLIYFAVWPMGKAVPMFLAVYALGLHFRCIRQTARAEEAMADVEREP